MIFVFKTIKFNNHVKKLKASCLLLLLLLL